MTDAPKPETPEWLKTLQEAAQGPDRPFHITPEAAAEYVGAPRPETLEKAEEIARKWCGRGVNYCNGHDHAGLTDMIAAALRASEAAVRRLTLERNVAEEDRNKAEAAVESLTVKCNNLMGDKAELSERVESLTKDREKYLEELIAIGNLALKYGGFGGTVIEQVRCAIEAARAEATKAADRFRLMVEAESVDLPGGGYNWTRRHLLDALASSPTPPTSPPDLEVLTYTCISCRGLFQEWGQRRNCSVCRAGYEPTSPPTEDPVG